MRITRRDGNREVPTFFLYMDRLILWCHMKTIFVSWNPTDKMCMVYPGKGNVATVDILEPLDASADTALNNIIYLDMCGTCVSSTHISRYILGLVSIGYLC